MLNNLIGIAIGSVLWGIWFMFAESTQDDVIELGGGFSAYFKVVFFSTLIVFSLTVAVSVLLRVSIDMFRLVKERDAATFTYLRYFRDFVILSCGLWVYLSLFYDPKKTKINLVEFALNNAEIIGASIALIFAFSIFALQRMASFLPARQIQFLTKNSKEGVFFGLLVFLIFISLFIPIFFPDSPKLALWGLLTTLLGCFFIVYFLYIGLSEKAYPEYSMQKIENDIIKFLKRTQKEHEYLQQKNDTINLFGSAQEKVKDLQEMGLKLLDKNEVQSFHSFLQHIQHIFIKHLNLGRGCFIGDISNRFFSTDKSLISNLQECLFSSGERVIQEKRDVLIGTILITYTLILEKVLNIKYADEVEFNPLALWVFGDYRKLIKLILPLENSQLTYTITQNLLAIYQSSIQKGDFNFVIFDILIDSLKQVNTFRSPQKAVINAAISDLEKRLIEVQKEYAAQKKTKQN